MSLHTYLVLALALASIVESARILIYIPTPSISHQVPIRPLTNELVRRGHEVVLLTTDPEYPPDGAPANLTEINIHDVSYGPWKRGFVAAAKGRLGDYQQQIKVIFTSMLEVIVNQLETPEVQQVLYNETFDLIIAEHWVRTPLIFSHFHKVPVIQITTLMGYYFTYEEIGAACHPTLYPHAPNLFVNDLPFWERIVQLYRYYSVYYWVWNFDKVQDEALRKFAPDHPGLSALSKNVAMTFLNVYPIWDSNRPVPPNVLYIGGIHQIPEKPLPKDIQAYLDSSKHGVVYISFGTNSRPSRLPQNKIEEMIRAFSRLPYDVLWRWDTDEFPWKIKNIRTSKWLPQADILRHPKVKLFITQGGLQSTDEALTAGVPLLAFPMGGDQYYNTDKYVHLKIGRKLRFDTFTENELYEEIEEVIGNPSYKKNIIALRDLLHDQTDTPVNRAAWWVEYVLKHGGAHLRPAGANMPWWEYLEINLILILLSALLLVIITVISILIYLYRYTRRFLSRKLKKE